MPVFAAGSCGVHANARNTCLVHVHQYLTHPGSLTWCELAFEVKLRIITSSASRPLLHSFTTFDSASPLLTFRTCVDSIAAFAALLGPTTAGPTSHVLHERRDMEITAYTKRGPVPVGIELPVRIGLTQRNLDSGS